MTNNEFEKTDTALNVWLQMLQQLELGKLACSANQLPKTHVLAAVSVPSLGYNVQVAHLS